MTGAKAGNRCNHFGDDLARSANDDRVTDEHPLALDFVRVVKRGHRDGHATNPHRLEHRERSDRTGAAHADHDVSKLGGLLFGGKLVRDGPARKLRRLSELVLIAVGVDLHHRAVDFVLERVPLFAHGAHVGFHFGQSGARLGLGMHSEPHLRR